MVLWQLSLQLAVDLSNGTEQTYQVAVPPFSSLPYTKRSFAKDLSFSSACEMERTNMAFSDTQPSKPVLFLGR